MMTNVLSYQIKKIRLKSQTFFSEALVLNLEVEILLMGCWETPELFSGECVLCLEQLITVSTEVTLQKSQSRKTK